MTNGCFDLLHAGHVSLLQFARAQGDVLVVGLNSDRSERALKGKSRPILPQRDREQILAAFEAVDYVVPFHETSVESLVRLVRPDVLVKGDHYSVQEVVGHRHAGRVALAPVVRGRSTSEIIRRIKNDEPAP
jgi:D-beta-D-heptose 7-phosphate kinase/D-beta-D-heptose 1-phosphate adenosyltransferase